MEPPDLTDEQEVALEPGVRVIEAGPGSGKTRLLLAKYL